METMKKRALSLILALVLALSLLPISVLATEGTRKAGDIVFTDSADTQPTEEPGDGFHWAGPTAKRGDPVCTLAHEHSETCVTVENAEEIGENAYTLGSIGLGVADKNMFFKLNTYYKLACNETEDMSKHSDACYATEGSFTKTADTDKVVTTYYQCTTPAHTHVDGCYKTQYAWVLTADTAVETHTYQVKLDCYTVKNGKTSQDGVSETLTRRVATEPTAAELLADVSSTAAAPKDTKIGKNNVYTRSTKLADFKSEGDFAENALVFTVKYYWYQTTTGTLTVNTEIAGLTPAELTTLTTREAPLQYLLTPLTTVQGFTQAFSYASTAQVRSDIRHGCYTTAQTNAAMPGYDLETTYSWDDADLKTPGQQIAIEAGDNGAITITNTYSKPKNDTTLTIHKIVNGLDGDDAALEALKKSLTFDINGDITFDYSLPVSYGKFIDSSYTTQQLEHAGTYTVTETGAEVPGYTLTTTCDDLDNDPANGYQFNVVAGKNTEITITNTYEKIPETVYSLIFDAGDNGVLQGGHATNGDPENSDFHWTLDTTTNQYNWEKANTGMGNSLKRWTFHFTEANVTENIALRSGMAAKSPTPTITANDPSNPFQGFYLMDGAQMTDTTYSTDNALFAAYTAMEAAGTDSLIYRAKYNVSTPVDPTPTPDPNPGGGDDGYEPQNPATPPVTTLPDGETPLADLPDSETPLADLPDEETPLADLPDEETPLADAPKTGDSVGIWAALLGVSGMAIAGLTLGKRKKTEEN